MFPDTPCPVETVGSGAPNVIDTNARAAASRFPGAASSYTAATIMSPRMTAPFTQYRSVRGQSRVDTSLQGSNASRIA